MDTDAIKQLAALARMRIADDEVQALSHEFSSILEYVNQITELSVDVQTKRPDVVNIVREDTAPEVSGTHTEKLVAAFPEKKDGYVSVKKVL